MTKFKSKIQRYTKDTIHKAKNQEISGSFSAFQRFSAPGAAHFHPSAEITELGTRYDILCSHYSDKII